MERSSSISMLRAEHARLGRSDQARRTHLTSEAFAESLLAKGLIAIAP
jgi:hypothetical protein